MKSDTRPVRCTVLNGTGCHSSCYRSMNRKYDFKTIFLRWKNNQQSVALCMQVKNAHRNSLMGTQLLFPWERKFWVSMCWYVLVCSWYFRLILLLSHWFMAGSTDLLLYLVPITGNVTIYLRIVLFLSVAFSPSNFLAFTKILPLFRFKTHCSIQNSTKLFHSVLPHHLWRLLLSLYY